MLPALPFRLTLNPARGRAGRAVLDPEGFAEAKSAITAWPGYEPTPLHDLPGLAAGLGVAAIRWKDEGARFGLGSFKALGGAYAVARQLRQSLGRDGIAATDADLACGRFADRTRRVTVACATDGNHGRAVAWGAKRFDCRAVVFVHALVSAGRAEAIARLGAEVRRAGATDDDTVRLCAETAARDGWTVISDTSWDGDDEFPRAVMQKYRLMAEEAFAPWRGDPPPHLFIQAGVGGAAAAIAAEAAATWNEPGPRAMVVEPIAFDAIARSLAAGRPVASPPGPDTLMAGLTCAGPRRSRSRNFSSALRLLSACPRRRWRQPCGCWRAASGAIRPSLPAKARLPADRPRFGARQPGCGRGPRALARRARAPVRHRRRDRSRSRRPPRLLLRSGRLTRCSAAPSVRDVRGGGHAANHAAHRDAGLRRA